MLFPSNSYSFSPQIYVLQHKHTHAYTETIHYKIMKHSKLTPWQLPIMTQNDKAIIKMVSKKLKYYPFEILVVYPIALFVGASRALYLMLVSLTSISQIHPILYSNIIRIKHPTFTRFFHGLISRSRSLYSSKILLAILTWFMFKCLEPFQY